MPASNATSEHKWLAACVIPVTERQARRAHLRLSVRFPKEMKIPVIETYCEQCRRTYPDVAGQPCVAAENVDHLIGGPTGTRKKRKHNHNCELLGCDLPATG